MIRGALQRGDLDALAIGGAQRGIDRENVLAFAKLFFREPHRCEEHPRRRKSEIVRVHEEAAEMLRVRARERAKRNVIEFLRDGSRRPTP